MHTVLYGSREGTVGRPGGEATPWFSGPTLCLPWGGESERAREKAKELYLPLYSRSYSRTILDTRSNRTRLLALNCQINASVAEHLLLLFPWYASSCFAMISMVVIDSTISLLAQNYRLSGPINVPPPSNFLHATLRCTRIIFNIQYHKHYSHVTFDISHRKYYKSLSLSSAGVFLIDLQSR